MTLLAVPNVSEGRDPAVLDHIGDGFTRAGVARLLDRHADPDHHRAVFTLAGEPGALARAVLDGARAAVDAIDLRAHAGAHPRVGALDVAPVVWLREEDRGAALAEALVLADGLGEELALPVYLYGILGDGRTRAELRRPGALAGLPPDFGPPRPHPTAGAVLVGARPPLVAFNVELAPPATERDAKRIAARVRAELPGVRALGLALPAQGLVQVSTNVEGPATPADVVALVREHAPVAGAELVGLAPRAALEGLPPEVPLRNRRAIEDLLGERPGPVQLREATEDDGPFLFEMLTEAVNWTGEARVARPDVERHPELRHYVAGWPRAGDLGVIAVDASGARVGAAWCRTFSAADPGYGFVASDVPEVSLAVVPGWRERGIGRRLLGALVDRARREGWRAVSLSVEEGNRAAGLYRATGFVTVARTGAAETMLLELRA